MQVCAGTVDDCTFAAAVADLLDEWEVAYALLACDPPDGSAPLAAVFVDGGLIVDRQGAHQLAVFASRWRDVHRQDGWRWRPVGWQWLAGRVDEDRYGQAAMEAALLLSEVMRPPAAPAP